MPHLAMDNGSGLSRSARLSARGLGQLLLHASLGPWGPEFISSLPLAGMDGSLRQRFRGLAPRGRIRLKTGRLSGVRAMAGYVTLSDNQTHAVVILINQEKLSNRIGDAAPAAVLRWLLRPR
jgi:D-alanyl-D-alanine carboxypeptidase/D-alanyl-D-alanine-endopeptidase (penicillin-binding protein 4)